MEYTVNPRELEDPGDGGIARQPNRQSRPGHQSPRARSRPSRDRREDEDDERRGEKTRHDVVRRSRPAETTTRVHDGAAPVKE